jgi:hypothetical protein
MDPKALNRDLETTTHSGLNGWLFITNFSVNYDCIYYKTRGEHTIINSY